MPDVLERMAAFDESALDDALQRRRPRDDLLAVDPGHRAASEPASPCPCQGSRTWRGPPTSRKRRSGPSPNSRRSCGRRTSPRWRLTEMYLDRLERLDAEPALRDHVHPRARAGERGAGGRAVRGGHRSRAAPRDPVGRQGPDGLRGLQDHVGGEALRGAGARRDGGGDRASRRRRRRARRQALRGRAGVGRRVVRGAYAESLGHLSRLQRLLRGLCVGRRRGRRGLRHWYGDPRFDRLPVGRVLHELAPPDLRACLQAGDHGALLVHGQDRPDHAHSRRRGDRLRRDRRA